MSVDEDSLRNPLPAAQHGQIDRICTAFEDAWRRGETPELEDSLRGFDASQSVRELLFAELLALEVHYRKSRRQTPCTADYQAKFPEYDEQIAQVLQNPPATAKTAGPSPPHAAPPPSSQDTLSTSDPAASSDSRRKRSRTHPAPCQPARIGRYEVLRELGLGAFGCVYLGRDPQLNRQVAIKVARRELFASDDSAARFLSEARKAAKVCKHPGIVTLHDVQRQDDAYYLVMDYVEGGTLDNHATTVGLTQVEIVELVARVADAVHFAHTHGLVHCDLKPANILIDGNGDPKVADFGLAVLESEQSHRKGERSGTPNYMSPEQVLGHVERLDGRTDVWSLGATLYELLTRRPPFSGDTRDELFDEILHRDAKPPRQINDKIPAALERICLKALSKKPADRHSTARDFARDLRQAAQPPLLRRLHLLAWMLGGLVLVLIGVLITLTFNPPRNDERDTGRSDNFPGPGGPSDLSEVGEPPDPDPPRYKREFGFPEEHSRPIICLAGGSEYAFSCDDWGTLWRWHLQEKYGESVPAMRPVWRIACSKDGQLRVMLHNEPPYVSVASVATMELERADYTGSPPEVLLPAKDPRRVWAVVPLKNKLQILEFPGGDEVYNCRVTGSWSCLAGAYVEGDLVFVGFVAEQQKWRLVRWRPGTLPSDDEAIDGAVCSVAISKDGLVVLGGYGPNLGVQVFSPDAQPLRLDNDKQEDRLYYHQVAISDDEKYVCVISRYLPLPGDAKPEHAVLRVWPIIGEPPVKGANRPCVIDETLPPVDAAMFLPEQKRILLSTGHTVEVLSLE